MIYPRDGADCVGANLELLSMKTTISMGLWIHGLQYKCQACRQDIQNALTYRTEKTILVVFMKHKDMVQVSPADFSLESVTTSAHV
jgi:hypothetical protein